MRGFSVGSATTVVVFCVGLALAPGAGLGATSPAITLPNSTVPAGSSVQLDAAGFAPYAQLTIELDQEQIGLASADSSGDLSDVRLPLPTETAIGQHLLVVLDAARNQSAAAPLLVVQASATPHTVNETMTTGSVGRLAFTVSLPPGYATGGQRYPVIYFLHGLPAGSHSYLGAGPSLLTALGADASRAIIVAPQAARDNDPDPEYLNWGSGRNWATALASDLPSYIDAHFRTIANRYGRALVGVSAGGYGAMILGLHHLSNFSVLESWSGYFEATNAAGTAKLTFASKEQNAQASAYAIIPRLRQLLRNTPTFIGFYVGDSDDRFRTGNIRFHRQLAAAQVPHAFTVYPGSHQQSLWAAHAHDWLEMALRHLQSVS